MTKAQILHTLHKLKPLYEKEGLSIVGLFGSYAKEDHDQFSDIDIAYHIDHSRFSQKFQDGFSKILRLEHIKEELESILHKKVDLISLDSSNTRFIESIRQEMIHV